MNVRRQEPDGRVIDHQIDLSRPVSIAVSLMNGAIIGAAAGLSGMSQVMGRGGRGLSRGASAVGLAAFGGVTSALNTAVSGAADDAVTRRSERFQPKGGVSNFVEEPYKKGWITRRELYGKSGRRRPGKGQ